MSDEPTLESLREMTGAPNLDDPLVSETAFDAVELCTGQKHNSHLKVFLLLRLS